MPLTLCIQRKNIKRGILTIVAIFVLWQSVFNVTYWKFIGRDIVRGNVASMVVRGIACRNFVDNNPEANQKFSEYFRDQMEVYDFDYYDVKFFIEETCPVGVDPESPSESYVKHVQWMQTLDKGSREKEKMEWDKRIEIERKIRDYKIRFLNGDFIF